ncbi:MAG: glycosyl hydrolase 2 galactose-binding domain-containing protein, partial [Christensenellales bacterium]
MTRLRQALKWQVGCCDNENDEIKCWMPATVPGCVQQDYAAYNDFPDYRVGKNYELFDGLEDKFWVYRAELPELDNMYLVCDGIDYRYDVETDGEVVYSHEGMVKPFSIPLKKGARELKIRIYPAPKKEYAEGRAQAAASCKNAVCYGWDFQPRLITQGIWRDCYIEVRDDFSYGYAKVSYELNESLTKARVFLDYKCTGGETEWKFGEKTVVSDLPEGRLCIEIDNPVLWYPNGAGRQYLYKSKVTLKSHGRVTDETESSVGLKRIRLVSRPRNWDSVLGANTRALPPVTVQVNGKEIFAKGTNWATPAVFPSDISDEDYERYLSLIRDANMNMIRCWGGCAPERDRFFRLCDEYGLMV